MTKPQFRTGAVVALCLVSGIIGGAVAHLGPVAGAAPASAAAPVATTSALGVAQATSGTYAILPIIDSGAGYTWIAYAMVISPEGHVTVINTHPKRPDEIGTIFKEFGVK